MFFITIFGIKCLKKELHEKGLCLKTDKDSKLSYEWLTSIANTALQNRQRHIEMETETEKDATTALRV